MKPMTTPSFRAVGRTVVANQAIDMIKSMILSGELHAFQRLPPERDLAEALGVSRPTLRESVRALIALNILESRHGEGTFVTSLEPQLLARPIDFVLRVDQSVMFSLFETRRILEAGVAGLAAERITDSQLAEVDRVVAEFEANVDDFDACLQLDVEFHRLIAVAAASPILSSLLESVAALSIESRRRTGKSLQVRSDTVAYHSAIAEAVRARDPERARTAMTAHLDHVATVAGPSGGVGAAAIE